MPAFVLKKVGSQRARRDGKDAPGTALFTSGLLLLRKVSLAVCELISPIHHEEMWEHLLQPKKRKKQHPSRQDRLVKTLVDMNIAAPRRSVVFRVTRAALFKALTTKEQQDLRSQYPDLCAFNSGGSQKFIYNDLNSILGKGEDLCKPQQKRARFSNEKLEATIRFMLSPSNISPLSWGTRLVRIDASETVALPVLLGRTDVATSFRRYRNAVRDGFGESSFSKLSNAIIAQRPRLLKSVDYVAGILVHETVMALQNLADSLFVGPQQRNFTRLLTVARNFMKVQYDSHLLLSDDVGTHGLQFALRKPVAGASPRCRQCNACNFPFYVLAEMTKTLDATSFDQFDNSADVKADALQLLGDTATKFRLYYGHRARVINQNIAIEAVMTELKDLAVAGDESKALLLIDWKMKFEMVSSHETSQEHFGKRGLPWHGAMLIFFRRKEVEIDGVRSTVAQRYHVYLDQIMSGYNKQSALSVICMIEAALDWIHTQFPVIKSVVLQSDNAKCYNSLIVKVGILLLNLTMPIFVERYLHSGIQAGKCLIDAHFARALAHILNWIARIRQNRTFSVATERGLADILSKPGLQNHATQLVSLDSSRLELLNDLITVVSAKLKKYFNQCADIIYHPIPDDQLSLDCSYEYSWNSLKGIIHDGVTLQITAYAHSNVDGTRFAIHMDMDGGGVEASVTNLGSSSCLNSPMPGNCDTAKEGHDGEDVEVGTSMGAAVESLAEESRSDSAADELPPVAVLATTAGGSCSESNTTHHKSSTNGAAENEIAAGDAAPVEDIDNGPMLNCLPISGAEILRLTVQFGSVEELVGQQIPELISKSKSKSPSSSPELSPRRDVVAAGVRMAADMIATEEIVRDKRDYDPECDRAAGFSIGESCMGWGRQPSRGESYGATYVGKFHGEIERLYNQGKVNKDMRASSAQIAEFLRLQHPTKFCLPGPWAVQQVFAKLGQQKPTTRRHSKMPEDVAAFVTQLVADMPDIKPAAALRRVLQAFPDLDAVWHQKVRTKTSALKTKAKTRARGL